MNDPSVVLSDLMAVAAVHRVIAHHPGNEFPREADVDPSIHLGCVPTEALTLTEMRARSMGAELPERPEVPEGRPGFEGIPIFPFLVHRFDLFGMSWTATYTVTEGDESSPHPLRQRPHRRLTLRYRENGVLSQSTLDEARPVVWSDMISPVAGCWFPLLMETEVGVFAVAQPPVPVKHAKAKQIVYQTPVLWTIVVDHKSAAGPAFAKKKALLYGPDGEPLTTSGQSRASLQRRKRDDFNAVMNAAPGEDSDQP